MAPQQDDHPSDKHWKRILVFADGTGQSAAQTMDQSDYSNVLRLSRCVPYWGDSHRDQIVLYLPGVGTEGGFDGAPSGISSLYKRSTPHEYHPTVIDAQAKIVASFGNAVATIIRDAYLFIAQNYVEGDEIMLFGFSRGAYIARKVAGLLYRLGILNPDEMSLFFPVFLTLSGLEVVNADLKGRAVKLIAAKDKQTEKPKVRCLGLFDTVGQIYVDGWVPTPLTNALSISDITLLPNVQYAFHALALHENRNRFDVTLLKAKKQDVVGNGGTQVLKQVWFAGAHSDVGGSYTEHELSDISLFWMVSQILQYKLIDLNLDFLRRIPAHYEGKPDWGTSKPHNPFKDSSNVMTKGLGGLVGGLLYDEIQRKPNFNSPDGDKDGYVTCEEFHPSLLQQPSNQRRQEEFKAFGSFLRAKPKASSLHDIEVELRDKLWRSQIVNGKPVTSLRFEKTEPILVSTPAGPDGPASMFKI